MSHFWDSGISNDTYSGRSMLMSFSQSLFNKSKWNVCRMFTGSHCTHVIGSALAPWWMVASWAPYSLEPLASKSERPI
jgi:hypothetical protein